MRSLVTNLEHAKHIYLIEDGKVHFLSFTPTEDGEDGEGSWKLLRIGTHVDDWLDLSETEIEAWIRQHKNGQDLTEADRDLLLL